MLIIQMILGSDSSLDYMLKSAEQTSMFVKPKPIFFVTSPAVFYESFKPEIAYGLSIPISSKNEFEYICSELQKRLYIKKDIKQTLTEISLLSEKDLEQYKKSFLNILFANSFKSIMMTDLVYFKTTYDLKRLREILGKMYILP